MQIQIGLQASSKDESGSMQTKLSPNAVSRLTYFKLKPISNCKLAQIHVSSDSSMQGIQVAGECLAFGMHALFQF
jgi:hypothetical protein